MRLPGYRNAEMVWDRQCDVLFDGVDFGPNLVYSSFDFTPANVRKVSQTIAGVSGEEDHTEALTGWAAYDHIRATLRLWVNNPREFVTPVFQDGQMASPEARFLSIVNGRSVKIEFRNSNGFYLVARPKIKTYTKYALGWDIVLDLEADPFWYEQGFAEIEWQMHNVGQNLFTGGENAPISAQPGASCTWSSVRNGFVLHAPVRSFAEATISGLQANRSYTFSCRAIQGPCYWTLYKGDGSRITDETAITGTTSIKLRMISQCSEYVAGVFVDIGLYDNSNMLGDVEIQTLDMPCTTLKGFSTAPCQLVLAGRRWEIPAGDDITVYGLDIPPRTTVRGRVVAESDCSGGLMYQRGAFSCTL